MRDTEVTRNGVTYFPGFHIWTTLDGANEYLKRHSYGCSIYKVLFSEVIAFGDNSTGIGGNKEPCVVANWIKYEHIINNLGDKVK